MLAKYNVIYLTNLCQKVRPSAIDKYCTVPARADPSQIGRGANNEFINGNGTPEKITE